ncbi:MAG: 2-hydroxy-3-oxopropionate reductase [Bacteroidales bacterium]|nr:2-hydroxy-3-oxopropionate reductase [Bacteroidales bacterium]
MYRIGFIGLGIMGKPMARNLLKAGYQLVVYDRNKDAVKELVNSGAAEGKSPSDVASRSEIIFTMLPNSPDVKEVALGDNGIIHGAKSGSVFIDMSSIAPLVSKEISGKLEQKGVVMLDAPVSGGEPKAIEGTLAIMVGGPEETFNNVKEILGAMGSSVKLVGDIGSGNITKLANQIIVALNIAAMGEAMVLATKAGVDPEKVYQAIRGGLAGSTVMDAKMPMILNGNFKPGFRIELHIKDLMNVMETARELDVPVSLTDQVLEMMKTLQRSGKGKDDHCSIIRYYEDLAGVEVRKK